MSGEQDPLIRMAGDVGYMRGAFDGMTEQNTKEHKDIVKRLEKGDAKFTEICQEVKDQKARHADLEGRVGEVEKNQKVIVGLAKFVNDHPRLILGVVAIVLVAVTGLSVDEVVKALGG